MPLRAAGALVKSRGAHYTPPPLATFLAESLLAELGETKGRLRVLDPACGSGALLEAIGRAAAPRLRRHLHLIGFDTQAMAVAQARRTLASLDVGGVRISPADFLGTR